MMTNLSHDQSDVNSRKALFTLEAVGKCYQASSDAPELSIFEHVDLVIAPGSSTSIVGPSGSGKSTLLNLIGGLDRPTSGRVLHHGIDLADFNARQSAAWRRENVGFVFQSQHLLPQCTALENTLIPTLVHIDRDGQRTASARAGELLERVQLTNRSDHYPAQLSGGECQRIALARALINEPKILLADEPTGSLDGGSAERMAELLLATQRDLGVALVVVTHSDRLAEQLDRVYRLGDGQLRLMASQP